jgi:hypothetical protein
MHVFGHNTNFWIWCCFWSQVQWKTKTKQNTKLWMNFFIPFHIMSWNTINNTMKNHHQTSWDYSNHCCLWNNMKSRTLSQTNVVKVWKKTLNICEITHVGTSLPTIVYEITTNHTVRIHENIINGYEKFMKAPLPTLWFARNFERANTVKLHDSRFMKHHENLAHESIGVPPILWKPWKH